MMNNTSLKNLYETYFPFMREIASRCSTSMEGPFLIAPPITYWKAKIKIAFVGQETYGWPSTASVDEQMQEYEEFALGKNYYSSPFWNVIRKIEQQVSDANYTSAWLNVNRYDEKGGKPSNENKQRLSKLDFLLLEELKIIQPDLVIFFTGPTYDERILNLLKGHAEPTAPFNIRQLCIIKTDEIKSKIFRTYHPNFLRRSGLECTVIESIRG